MAVAATHQQRQIDVVTRERINNVLTVLMAGRASEEILLGAPSAGAGGDHESDLARASNVASQAVTNWGLGGGSSAPRWRGIRHGTDHFPVPLPQHVDTEIDTMLAKAYAAAGESMLTANGST